MGRVLKKIRTSQEQRSDLSKQARREYLDAAQKSRFIRLYYDCYIWNGRSKTVDYFANRKGKAFTDRIWDCLQIYLFWYKRILTGEVNDGVFSRMITNLYMKYMDEEDVLPFIKWYSLKYCDGNIDGLLFDVLNRILTKYRKTIYSANKKSFIAYFNVRLSVELRDAMVYPGGFAAYKNNKNTDYNFDEIKITNNCLDIDFLWKDKPTIFESFDMKELSQYDRQCIYEAVNGGGDYERREFKRRIKECYDATWRIDAR